jgi:hypothetical protein
MPPSLAQTNSASDGHWIALKAMTRCTATLMFLDHAIDNSRSSAEHRHNDPESVVKSIVSDPTSHPHAQQRGDAWHPACSTPLLQVPSAIMPLAKCPDRNVLINHAHPDAATIKAASSAPFSFAPRLI